MAMLLYASVWRMRFTLGCRLTRSRLYGRPVV